MVKRRVAELKRQKEAVQLKERLYGRSMQSLEGGPEFEVRRAGSGGGGRGRNAICTPRVSTLFILIRNSSLLFLSPPFSSSLPRCPRGRC